MKQPAKPIPYTQFKYKEIYNRFIQLITECEIVPSEIYYDTDRYFHNDTILFKYHARENEIAIYPEHIKRKLDPKLISHLSDIQIINIIQSVLKHRFTRVTTFKIIEL